MATIEKQPDSGIVLMIDNETLSLRPTAHLTQIGFVVGDYKTRQILVPRTTVWMTDDQPKADIDLGTVRWWMGQDQKVSKGVFMPPEGSQRVTAKELANVFKEYVAEYPDMTVYASPAMFDLPQLTHLFDGRKPWKYNAERDLMTLYKHIDPFGELQPPQNDTHHDAGSDAEWQFHYLCNVMDKFAKMENVYRAVTGPKEIDADLFGTLPGAFDESLKNPGA